MTWRAWQNGRCAMCGLDSRGMLVTDHCHRSGFERGELCRGCNVSEGQRDSDLWESYRQRPPSVICQDVYVYVGYGGEAVADEWIEYILGARPPAGSLDAAAYLVSAANLERDDHFNLFTGEPLRPPHPSCPQRLLASRSYVRRPIGDL